MIGMPRPYLFVFSLIFCSFGSVAQNSFWTVKTFAGNGGNTWSGDGVMAESAAIGQGYSIEYDPATNRLYICTGDYLNEEPTNRVSYVDVAGGTIHNFLGNGMHGHMDSVPRTTAQVVWPGSIAIDDTGNFYVTEFYGNRVLKIKASDDMVYDVSGKNEDILTFGDVTALAFAESEQIGNWTPLGIAQSPLDGMMYWAEFAVIRRLNYSTGKVEIVVGDTTSSALAPNGAPAIFNQEIDPVGAIAFDPTGNYLYFSSISDVIQRIDFASNTIETVVGTGNYGYNGDGLALSTDLYDPYGLKFGPDGNLWWVEKNNGFVRKLVGDSVITVLGKSHFGYGSPNQDYNGELINADSVRMRPYDLEFGPDGEIYVMDFKNFRVRKFFECYPATLAGLNYDHQPCPGDTVQIQVDGNLGSALNWYLTEGSTLGPILDSGIVLKVAVQAGVNYFVTSKGAVNQCGLTDAVLPLDFTIGGTGCEDHFTIFTPNDDGINDYLHIKLAEKYPVNKVRILNRNGDIVSSIDDYNNLDKSWDGANPRGRVSPGTYFILFSGNPETASEHEETYWIELIR